MDSNEMRLALQSAKNTLNAADNVADDMARMLVGRLRKVWSNDALIKLKRELRNYNIHTGRWSDK